MDPNTVLHLGTERMTMNSLVPFRSVPKGGIEFRHALRNSLAKAILIYIYIYRTNTVFY